MFRTGYVLGGLRSIAVDIDNLPTLAPGATEIRIEGVIAIGFYFDLQDSRHVKHVVNVLNRALYAMSLWCFDGSQNIPVSLRIPLCGSKRDMAWFQQSLAPVAAAHIKK